MGSWKAPVMAPVGRCCLSFWAVWIAPCHGCTFAGVASRLCHLHTDCGEAPVVCVCACVCVTGQLYPDPPPLASTENEIFVRRGSNTIGSSPPFCWKTQGRVPGILSLSAGVGGQMLLRSGPPHRHLPAITKLCRCESQKGA